MGLCTLCSLVGTAGARLPRSVRHVSTFLPPFPRPGFAARASRRPAQGRSSTMRAPTPGALAHARQVSPLSCLAVRASNPQPRKCSPGIAFAVASNVPGSQSSGFAIVTQARRCTPPKRVRHPAGCSFASGCFPPRLTATQLPSATCVVTSHGLDSHPPVKATSRTHVTRYRANEASPQTDELCRASAVGRRASSIPTADARLPTAETKLRET